MKRLLVLLTISLALACGDESTSAANGSSNTSALDAGSPDASTNSAQNNGSQGNADMGDAANASSDGGTDASTEQDMGADTSMPTPFGDPSGPGTFGVTTSTTNVALGGEQIPVDIYLPDASGTYPTVIFHHGFSLSPSLYESYGERLASWGYVALFPEMPGGFIGGPTHVELKDYVVELMTWVEGNGATPAGPLEGKADTTTFVVAGHSLGGKISFLTATEDARVDAIFAIDPVDSAGGPGAQPSPDNPSVTPELMGSITVPMGIVGETFNATCSGFFCQACAPEEDNFEQYYMAATSPAYVLDVLNADHMSFLDNSNCANCFVCDDGSDDPAVTKAITQTTMIAFLELKVRGTAEARAWLTGADAPAANLAVHDTKNGF